MVELVGALHKAGVTIVAGTDGQGIELVRELELYKKAGFTQAEALADRDHRPGAHGRRRTSAPDRSRSARKPTWCWSTATFERTSARSAAS